MFNVCISPSLHFRVVVDGYIGTEAVVVRAEMAVGSTKPLVKAMLQRQVLSSVPKVPEIGENGCSYVRKARNFINKMTKNDQIMY